jgi:hypothetical protein
MALPRKQPLLHAARLARAMHMRSGGEELLMTGILRVLFGAALVVTLGCGLFDCQPCEDPSQLFCQDDLSLTAEDDSTPS